MTPFLEDTDFTLYVGDVREVLRELPDGCVDCVVTSPPYWGLRDYGTGSWVGGDSDCDHKMPSRVDEAKAVAKSTLVGSKDTQGHLQEPSYRDVCGKCGATRQDQQLGLEPTPDAYVENMVGVFREVRRVLADHGTCWVNLGDSYNSNAPGGLTGGSLGKGGRQHRANRGVRAEGGADFAGTPATILDTTSPQAPSAVIKPKDLVGIPWRIAFALQADGWYLRSDIIWSKPNQMPESVTDRPTKAHEYVFLLSKRPRYWFDAEAVREPAIRVGETIKGDYGDRTIDQGVNGGWLKGGTVVSGRNVRSVWEIATQPYPEAHFATYPEELVRRCLLAGCPEWVCGVCGRPRERIVEREGTYGERKALGYDQPQNMVVGGHPGHHNGIHPPGKSHDLGAKTKTVGWSDCGHNYYRPGIVLDPFIGSGTTAAVARKHGRRTIGIELNPAYAQLATKRTRQLSLLA